MACDNTPACRDGTQQVRKGVDSPRRVSRALRWRYLYHDGVEFDAV